MRRAILALTIVAALSGAAAGAIFLTPRDVPTDPPTVAEPPEPTAVPVPEPVPTPTPSPTGEPTATPTPTAAPTPTEEDEVAAVQQALTDQGYYVGAIDGRAGPATASAVQAFQKLNGLVADGVIGPQTLAALNDPAVPQLRGGPADRIEVDLDRQVLFFVQGGRLERILPVSTGSGSSYTAPGGGTARSLTPVGTFRIERHISGERNAPLGTLYDPLYFHGGWAIHGSNSVPAYPASHGCVRVTRADGRWLFDRAPIGTTVIVYGERNSFDPGRGETAGTSAPAGDTEDTTPPDGIQTPDPEPTVTTPPEPAAPPQPTAPPEPAPTTAPPAPPPPAPSPTAAPTPTPTVAPEPSAPATAAPAPTAAVVETRPPEPSTAS